jgi:hypothetical protein
VSTTEQLIADIFEQFKAESEEVIDYESFYDDLMFCAQNPINVNKTNRDELDKLQFLSEIQIENILSYVYEFGPLHTIYELQLIEGLDMTDIRRMLPFVRIGEGDDSKNKIYLKDLMRYGKNELLLRIDKGLETKEGYQWLPDEDVNAPSVNPKLYLGNELYNSLKYRFHYKDRVQFGFSAEKDAGEQFWGNQNKGYDFYSFHVQLNNLGKFKTIVLGDFRANFGQGLVLHPEFSMGKSSYVLNVAPRNSGLKKFSSTDEYNFFRGGGATVKLGKFDLTAFYSNKMIDGDTINGTFPTIIKTGYHRTLDDLAKKQTVNQQIIGGNATYTNMNLQIGFTAVHTRLDNNLMPDKSVYNHFYFSGDNQTTGGIFYRYRWNKLNLFGETAMTGNGALAMLNGCYFSPASQVSLVVLQRYYSPEYDTFYASGFASGSRINNESGIYIGAEVRPFKKWKFAAYADNYRFPWPKFGVDAPSLGQDYLFQADFATRKNLTMYWRLRYNEGQSNLSGSTAMMPIIVPQQKASLRYQLNYDVGNFSFKNLVEGNLVRVADGNWTYGLIALQDVSYEFPKIPLQLDFRMQFFDAVDYDNRVYAYEKDVLYAFSIPMFSGIGSRYYLNVKYEISKQFSIWFKIAQTVYADDREALSSGNEAISGNRKTDIRLLLKWGF